MRSLAPLFFLCTLALPACGGDAEATMPPPAPDAAPGSPDASPAPDASADAAPDAAPDATPGPDAPAAAPTTLTPSHGFLGAELDVAFTGDLAATPPASVDFGAGITVSSFAPGDGHVATAHLHVAPGATLGAHDVHVALAGGASITLPAAFTVEPGLAVTTRGPRTQGSLLAVDLESLDPAYDLGIAPFAISAVLPRAPDYPNLFGKTVVMIPPGLAPGPYQVAWLAPFASGVPYSAPDAIVVEPFDPPLLAPGETTFATLSENESHVYRVHAPAASVVTVQALGLSEPTLWLFDGAGGPADRLRVEAAEFHAVPRAWTETPSAGEDLFVVVHASRYHETHFPTTLRLDVRPATVTEQDDAATHASAETAQPTTGCVEGCVLRGVIAPGETHVYVVPARPAAGALFTGLRADSADVLVRTGTHLPGDDFLRASQRLARPIAVPDRFFFASPRYVTIGNTGTTAQPYAVSLRWQPLAAGEDPTP